MYVNVSGLTTADEIVSAAGLDWEVTTETIYRRDDNGEFHPISGHRGIVRGDTQYVLDVTGTRFRPIQNREALAGFLAATHAGGLTITGVGDFRNGEYIYADAITETVTGRETLQGRLYMIQPHQHGKAFTVRFTVYRQNGTYHTFAVDSRACWRMSHASQYNDAKKADMVALLGLTKTMLTSYAARLDELAGKSVSIKEQLHYVARIIQPDLLAMDAVPESIADALLGEDVNRRFRTIATILADEQDGTALGAYNAVSRALDFEFGRSDENRQFNNLIGTGVKIKARALDWA